MTFGVKITPTVKVTLVVKMTSIENDVSCHNDASIQNMTLVIKMTLLLKFQNYTLVKRNIFLAYYYVNKDCNRHQTDVNKNDVRRQKDLKCQNDVRSKKKIYWI